MTIHRSPFVTKQHHLSAYFRPLIEPGDFDAIEHDGMDAIERMCVAALIRIELSINANYAREAALISAKFQMLRQLQSDLYHTERALRRSLIILRNATHPHALVPCYPG